jgi:hypothetical protein
MMMDMQKRETKLILNLYSQFDKGGQAGIGRWGCSKFFPYGLIESMLKN